MNQSDLERALQPVKQYFSGREVTVNSVLAAYLRADGLPASGLTWEMAKRALGETGDFRSAVVAAGSSSKVDIAAAPIATNERPAPFDELGLQWFAKQFGPGDIDGLGAKRLLGTPNIEPAAVLVREMAQNSWDARGKTPSIEFTLNLRCLRGETLDRLRRDVFTGDAGMTGVPDLLRRDAVWALEVSDRGTVGLGGPLRNDLAVDLGEDTNFIDLVFNIGAPRDVHLGAGTYGFGKTIAYVISGVGSVLIWSRCEGRAGLEHRLIGSAISEAFNRDGYRYTGRHWWGNAVVHEDRVEPVVGSVAERIADGAFARGFSEHETGTSILILDPQLGGSSPEEDSRRLADAVLWNLWPKLMDAQPERQQMNVSVQLNGVDVPIPRVEDHPVLGGHARCLLAVRAAQSGIDAPPAPYPVEVHEIWCKLPSRLLGHLALARYPARRGDPNTSHSITLMRNQAELVVRPFERSRLDVEGFQWAGVFKPTAEVDDSFAAAEPPAHDDWVPQSVPDKASRRDVNVALRRIREVVDLFLSPRNAASESQAQLPSAAVVGDMLADLLGGLEGPAPSSRTKPSKQQGRRAVRPRVVITDSTHTPAARAGWTRTSLEITLVDAAGRPVRVDVGLSVGVDGGSWRDTEMVVPLGWLSDTVGVNGYITGPAMVDGSAPKTYVFEAHSDLAIDVDARLVEE